jgi:SnoaL-like domain
MISSDDWLTILNMVSEADDFATARDVEGYISLFTADASIRGTEGSFAGPGQIRQGVLDVWNSEPPGTRHLSTTVSVSSKDDHSATAHFTLILASVESLTIVGLATVVETFVRTSEGWRISIREISA